MLSAGMNVARLNFSHGDFDSHARVIERLRQAASRVGRRVAIMADLPGPKIRIGELSSEPVELANGDIVTSTVDEIIGDASRFSVNFERLQEAVGQTTRCS
jgi:pyruvate kinase